MAKVLAGQQARGGGGKTFERQVRHTSGKKRTGDTKNPPSVNKYKNLIGQTKPKQGHQNGWMRDCRCKGAGTCSVCIKEREAEQREATRRAVQDNVHSNTLSENQFFRRLFGF